MQVLVVDDDPEIRETLCLILRDEGYDTLEAGDGGAAIERMRDTSEPLLVLLDMRMPGVNGEITLLTALAHSALWSRLSFIIMTANPQLIRPGMREMLRLRDIPLLVKPFDIDIFLDLLSQRAQRFDEDALVEQARNTRSPS